MNKQQLNKHKDRLSHDFNLDGYVSIPGFSQTILDFGLPYDQDNSKSFPCKAGHIIAHHSLTIHWADGNTSGDQSRQAMGAI